MRLLSSVVLLFAFQSAFATLDEDWLRAVRKRDVGTIERLLGHGVDVNLSTKDGKTALMLAAQRGRADIIGALLNAGAAVDQRNTRGGTALMYAAVLGDQQTVDVLLSRGAAINLQSSNGWTALMIAAVQGYEGLVRGLLSHGADANLADIYGWTPLMRAVAENRFGVVRILLASKSVDVNARNDAGATALMIATASGYDAIVDLINRTLAERQATKQR